MLMQSLANEVSRTGEAAPESRRFGLDDAVQQISLTLKGLYHFVAHPTSRQTFTMLSEGLVRFRSNHDAVRYMLQDERVARLCRERYVGEPYVIEKLLQYP